MLAFRDPDNIHLELTATYGEDLSALWIARTPLMSRKPNRRS